MVSVTLYLESAFCKPRTTLLEQQERLLKNASKLMKFGEDLSELKKENMPSALNFKTPLPIHSPELFATLNTRGSSQPSGNTAMNKARRPLVLLLTSDLPVIWQIKPGICWTDAMASSIQAMVRHLLE